VIQPVRRRSVPDDVFEQLAAEVMAGILAPGEPLPSERRLAELLGVSRPAVREALQRLAQAGLVEVRQGDTTTVRDFRRHGGLELLPRLLILGGDIDLAVARSLLEARRMIGPQVAALAARKLAKDADRRSQVAGLLRTEVRRLEASEDPIRRQVHALTYWDHVVDACDSIAFRLMFNSLRAAYEPALEAMATVMAAEVDQIETYETLAAALAAGDVLAAKAAAQELLEPVTDALISAIELLEATEDPAADNGPESAPDPAVHTAPGPAFDTAADPATQEEQA
jgi:GntR family transcriptional regulator, transcriptional repressor for pyruvate dehydrogenase complex